MAKLTMNRTHLLRTMWMMIVVALLAACGASQPAPTAAPVPTPAAEVREWNYVALGDSVSYGLVPRYAKILEQDLGVKVTIQRRPIGGIHSTILLDALRTSELLRKQLREADVITVEIPWNAVEAPCMTFVGAWMGGDCGGADNQDCLRKGFGIYMADTDAIFAEIVSLRSPSKALIRAMDTYQFHVRDSKENGTYPVINKYWRAANAHVIEVATRYHIPVARAYDAFSGGSGTDDIRDHGWGADARHLNDEGSTILAELFRQLGYEYAPDAQ